MWWVQESWGKFFIAAFGRALPPPYNVGSSVDTRTHTCTHAQTHTPGRGKWQPSSVFLPGESHGQRSLVGYNPWDYKEPDMTEWLTHTYGCMYVYMREGKNYIYIFAQLWSSICDPMDCSPPGYSVHGILQARILEWVAISFSRGLPDPGIEPRSPAWQADSFLSEPLDKTYYRKMFPSTGLYSSSSGSNLGCCYYRCYYCSSWYTLSQSECLRL